MDVYHIFQVMPLDLLKGGSTCSWDFGYLVALLGVEVGLDSAAQLTHRQPELLKTKKGMKNYCTTCE